MPRAHRAESSTGLQCCGGARLPLAQGPWFGSGTCCMELMLAMSVLQSVSFRPELGVPGQATRMGATRLHPALEQWRQPRALSSPPWLGYMLGCLCKLSLRLTAGLGHFSPPCIPYVMFSQCSPSTGCPGILFLLAVPSLAWSELPAPGWVLCKPQGAAGANAMVCGMTQAGGQGWRGLRAWVVGQV